MRHPGDEKDLVLEPLCRRCRDETPEGNPEHLPERLRRQDELQELGELWQMLLGYRQLRPAGPMPKGPHQVRRRSRQA